MTRQPPSARLPHTHAQTCASAHVASTHRHERSNVGARSLTRARAERKGALVCSALASANTRKPRPSGVLLSHATLASLSRGARGRSGQREGETERSSEGERERKSARARERESARKSQRERVCVREKEGGGSREREREREGEREGGRERPRAMAMARARGRERAREGEKERERARERKC
eukprot:6184995-Pleurochrysis_carterae.AAC.2